MVIIPLYLALWLEGTTTTGGLSGSLTYKITMYYMLPPFILAFVCFAYGRLVFEALELT